VSLWRKLSFLYGCNLIFSDNSHVFPLQTNYEYSYRHCAQSHTKIKNDQQSMGKDKIWHPANQKPLKRSSPNSIHVITSCQILGAYNQTIFGHDPSRGFFSPYTRNIHPMFPCLLLFFVFFVRVVLPIFQLLTHSLTILPIAYRQHTSADLWRGSAQGSAFWGLEKYNLIFNPIFCKMES